ncbi:MAG: hypothetical protein J6X61_03685 [Clostridia bacterium]|nr:hypothetical protein [Clostridia bacterium]
MNKDEILERSRRENKNMDERERDALARAGRVASGVGGLVCGVILILEAIFAGQISYAIWAVYLSITGTTLLYKFLRLRRKHELIFGLIELALAAVFLVFYILQLTGVVTWMTN